MSRQVILRLLRRTGVCAILDGGLASPAGLLQMARRLRSGGVRVFQLRMKAVPDRVIVSTARIVKQGLPGCAVLLNDRCDLAVAAGADGVHLGQDDLPVAAARRIIRARALVGVSAGTPRELACACRERPDYISVGPAYATHTKRDAGPALGIPGVGRLTRRFPASMPALAVGGITLDNAGGLIRAGVDAVAIASWWWRQRDPGKAAAAVLRAVASARA